MPFPRSASCRRAFSLIELVAALTIFSIAVVALLGSFGVSLQTASLSENRATAAVLAQQVMDETKAEGIYYPGEDGGEFGEGFERFSWTREILSTDQDYLYELRVTVSWDERGKTREVRLVTFAAERSSL